MMRAEKPSGSNSACCHVANAISRVATTTTIAAIRPPFAPESSLGEGDGSLGEGDGSLAGASPFVPSAPPTIKLHRTMLESDAWSQPAASSATFMTV